LLDSRLFYQAQASAMVGTGIFAGVAFSGQYADGAISPVPTSTRALHSEINVGAGYGGSASLDIGLSGTSVAGYDTRLPGGRIGFAAGAAAGIGLSTISTIPGRTIRQTLQSVPHLRNYVSDSTAKDCKVP
jgi:hypothetical protein